MDYEVVASFDQDQSGYGMVKIEIRKNSDGTFDICEVNLGFVDVNRSAEQVILWLTEQLDKFN